MLYKATPKLKKRRPETLVIGFVDEAEYRKYVSLIGKLKRGEAVNENDYDLAALLEQDMIEPVEEIKELNNASTD